MSEQALCEKKPKKAKKKRFEPHALDKIPEEIKSFQELQNACQDAADLVFMNAITDAVHLSLAPSQEELKPSTGAEEMNDSTILSAELNTVNEIEIRHKGINEEDIDTVIAASFNDLVENDEDNDFRDDIMLKPKHEESANESGHEYAPTSEIPKYELVIAPCSEKPTLDNEVVKPEKIEFKTLTTSVEQETSRSSLLKPSVFVGRSKVYSSSLQVGCQWDRTKYNVVLLPDLSKIVYPDLNSLLTSKPNANSTLHASSSKDHFMCPNITVDRSSKPKPPAGDYQVENNEMNHANLSLQLHSDSRQNENLLYKENKPDKLLVDYKLNAVDSRFTDYKIDGVDFRVFMNPVKWDPVDNCQLIVFRVGPLYYEEFFTNCGSTRGLVQAIKKEAESLTKRQLQLAQTCLLTEFNDCKSFRIPNATVVIYGNATHFDFTAKWLHVRFGVNEAFYEEKFKNGFTCFEELVKAVKSRAGMICTQQRNLKAKAYTAIPDEVSDTLLHNLENYDFNEEMADHKNDSSNNASVTGVPGIPKPSPARKPNVFQRKFKSVRQWLKGTFSKKTDKSSPPANVATTGGSNDALWQWNDSVEVCRQRFPTNEESKNVKE